ncbi:thioredoxin family protein [Pontiella agarivorans]|uniref:Thioredoxin family protein n=1 Tax=Pontiella agarivorans TaxID=3038953 RepID=A0ABU5MZ14_9BACT|nr:thioredoxin family protein [Pontiella agarivorans]MDZ8119434.1 thioredoxin family protein [Pontiella agarivorans]
MIKCSTTAILLAAGIATSAAALEIGNEIVATHVKMQSIDDATLTLSELKGGKGTLVVFSSSRCPVVLSWQKTMVDIGNTYSKKGIGVIFINSNDPDAKGDTFENMKKMAREEGYQFPFLADSSSEVARSFGATKTPEVFLFDADDKLVYKGAVGEGGRSVGDEIWLKDALDALLAGEEIKKPVTKSIGCGIDFRP